MNTFINEIKLNELYELFTVQKAVVCGYGIWYKDSDLLELSYSDNPKEFSTEFKHLIKVLHLEEQLNEILTNNRWPYNWYWKG